MVIIDNGELLKLPCGLCRLSNLGAYNCDEEQKTQLDHHLLERSNDNAAVVKYNKRKETKNVEEKEKPFDHIEHDSSHEFK